MSYFWFLSIMNSAVDKVCEGEFLLLLDTHVRAGFRDRMASVIYLCKEWLANVRRGCPTLHSYRWYVKVPAPLHPWPCSGLSLAFSLAILLSG